MKNIILAGAIALLSTNAFASESNHSCDRLSMNSNGFKSSASAATWYPEFMSFSVNTETGKANYKGRKGNAELRYDNKRVTITIKTASSSGNKVTHKLLMLANGEVHADLRTGGGFRSVGGAVYKCSNWDGNYLNTNTSTESADVKEYSAPSVNPDVTTFLSSSSKLVIDTKTGTAVIKSGSRHFEKVLKKVKRGAGVDIGYLEFTSKPSWKKTKLYDFDLVGASEVTITGNKELTIKDIAIEYVTIKPTTKWIMIAVRSQKGGWWGHRFEVK